MKVKTFLKLMRMNLENG